MMKKKDKESEVMFSDLPDTILHEIMCLLPIKDSFRTGTVSKKFTSAWYSIPKLNFFQVTSIGKDQFLLKLRSDRAEISELVPFDFVLDCLRLRTPNVSLKKFQMVFNNEGTSSNEDSRVDEAILMALEKGVRELYLHFFSNTEFLYRVPNKVFSADSITFLLLNAFTMSQPNLIIDSPVMEELYLADVSGSGSAEIQVSSPKLKSAVIARCRGFKRIEIKSLALDSFKHFQYNDDNCMIEISASRSLKKLALEGSSITDQWLGKNLPKFLALESLELRDCRLVTFLHVLNDGIKLVEVKEWDNLRRIVIDAKSLETFEYETKQMERGKCEIRILHCKNLVLVGASITDSWNLRRESSEAKILMEFNACCGAGGQCALACSSSADFNSCFFQI